MGYWAEQYVLHPPESVNVTLYVNTAVFHYRQLSSMQLSLGLWTTLGCRSNRLRHRFDCVHFWHIESLEINSCQTHQGCSGYNLEVCSQVPILGLMNHVFYLSDG